MRSTKFKNARIVNGLLHYAPRGFVSPVLPYTKLSRMIGDQDSFRYTLRKLRRSLADRDDPLDRAKGFYFDKLKKKRRHLLEADKKPVTDQHHVGVEIEFLSHCNEEEVIDAFAEAALFQYVTYHSDGSVQGSGSDGCDGSCRDSCDGSCYADSCECAAGECECNCECECSCSTEHGHEICILANANEIESVIERVCCVLNDRLSASVNKTCGLHVHLDVRHKKAALTFSKLVMALPFLASLVPSTRLKNRFCVLNGSDKISEHSGRYYAVNPQSIRKHKTVEVRLHSGTTDPAKIIHWVRLLRFFAYTRKSSAPVKSFKQLIQEGLDPSTVFYAVNRFTKFRSSKTPWVPEEKLNAIMAESEAA